MKVSEYIDLNEELDEPTKFTKLSTGKYMFNIDKDKIYICSFEDTENSNKRISNVFKTKIKVGAKIKNFSFTEHTNEIRQGTQNLTGTGHVKKVFSTLIEILKDYINSQNPEYLMFAGDEYHYKFYRFLINNIHKYTDKYRVIVADAPNLTNPGVIIIERKDNVNENFEGYHKSHFNSDLPIFSFPLKSGELKELKKANNNEYEFRFIADSKKKKLYVFPYKLFHNLADEAIGLNKYSVNSITAIYGYLRIIDGKLETNCFKHEIFSKRWEFLKQYIKLEGIPNVNEDFVKYADSNVINEKDLPIFVFPLSESEKKHLIEANGTDKDFRIIADSNEKKLYIFPARLFHLYADEALGIYKYHSDKPMPPDVIYGYAEIKKGKFYSYSFSNKNNGRWNFALKYLEGNK